MTINNKEIKVLLLIAICAIGCKESETKVSFTDKKQDNQVSDGGNYWIEKVKVDSIEYLVVKSSRGGVAIIKHGN